MLNELEILEKTNQVGQEIHLTRAMDIVFWILMGLNLIFIAIAKTLRPGYLRSLFSTAIINRQLLQNFEEDLKLYSFSSFLLSFTYFSSIGVLISQLSIGGYGMYALFVIAILIGVFISKWFSMWLISFVTENKSGILEHSLNHLVYFQVTGVILTPIVILTHYLPGEIQLWTIWICFGLSALSILIRELQTIARALKARISLLYIILYLCTLELLPLVVFIYAFDNKIIGLN